MLVANGRRDVREYEKISSSVLSVFLTTRLSNISFATYVQNEKPLGFIVSSATILCPHETVLLKDLKFSLDTNQKSNFVELSK